MTLKEHIEKYGDIPLSKPKGVSQEQWKRALDLYEVAKNKGDKYPELTVAQAALETAWFKKPSGDYNYFGQKASKSQKGTTKATREVEGNKSFRTQAKFRDYNSLNDAVDDRIKKWSSKYKSASNINEAISSIWQYDEKTGKGKGYATDDKYDAKLKTVLGMMGVSSDKKAAKDEFDNLRERRPDIVAESTRTKIPSLATPPINGVSRAELLQFDKLQSIDQNRIDNEQAINEAYNFNKINQSQPEQNNPYYDLVDDGFDPYNYIQLQEYQSGGRKIELPKLQERKSLTEKEKKDVEAYMNKLNNEVPRFNRDEDLGFMSNKIGELFIGPEKMNKIQGLYNKLVDFKNERGDSEMTPEEIDLRRRMVNAQSFSYLETPSNLSSFVDRVEKGESQNVNNLKNEDKKELRKELNAKYYGIDYNEDLVIESKYKPSNSKNKDDKYFDMAGPELQVTKSIIRDKYKNFDNFHKTFKEAKRAGQSEIGGIGTLSQLGKFKMSSGEDEKGKYVSYYDIWDMDIPGLDFDINAPNNPFEIYGRIYENDFNSEESQKQNLQQGGSIIIDKTRTRQPNISKLNLPENTNTNITEEDFNSILKSITKPKDFLTDYIKSPKYRERLQNSGYKNIDKVINNRLKRVENTEIIKGKTPKGSFYKDLQLIADPVQADSLGVNLDDIIVHELGHAETNNPKGISTAMFTPRNDLNTFEQDQIRERQISTKRLRKWEEEFTEEFLSKKRPEDTVTKSIQEIIKTSQVQLDNALMDEGQRRLEEGIDEPLDMSIIHDEKATEVKSDLNALRYNLFTNDISDPKKENVTKEHLKKLENNFIKNRLLKVYSEEDLIWLMNNIAANDKKEDIEFFGQEGGKKTVQVESKNDPRYKAYRDSLSLYKNNYSVVNYKDDYSKDKIRPSDFVKEYGGDRLMPLYEKPKEKVTIVPREKQELINTLQNQDLVFPDMQLEPGEIKIPEVEYWDVEIQVNKGLGSSKTTKRVYNREELEELKRKQKIDESSTTGKNNKLIIKPKYKI